MPDTINLMTIQITVKSNIGKTMQISRRFTEKELQIYKQLLRDTCIELGFEVEDIAAGYNNAPVGAVIIPIEVIKTVKSKPEPIEPEPEIDLNTLEQYHGKPTLKK